MQKQQGMESQPININRMDDVALPFMPLTSRPQAREMVSTFHSVLVMRNFRKLMKKVETNIGDFFLCKFFFGRRRNLENQLNLLKN